MATAALCWGLGSVAAHLVVVAGTQYYDGSGLGASDYPITDLIQMIGRASRPQVRAQAGVAAAGWWGSGYKVGWVDGCGFGWGDVNPAWVKLKAVGKEGDLLLGAWVHRRAAEGVSVRSSPAKQPTYQHTCARATAT